ncbi:MAG: alpha/beta hydrolase [Pseudomonadales bacterium]|nr:alpha/beta hydrolase [Pseudomonadales bacterium]
MQSDFLRYKSSDAACAPEIDRIAGKVADLASRQKPLEQCTPEEARELRESRGNPFAPDAVALKGIDDVYIPLPSGPMLARIYRPLTEAESYQPALVYFHGGGFVLGSVAGHDTLTRLLARNSGCTVISVEYRLAPECKSGDTIAEAFEAFCWLRAHATGLGLDARRFAIGGDSAGGNLAISVILTCLRQEQPLPCYQLLFYPITDWRLRTASIDEFATGFFLTRAGMHWFRAHYLETESLAEDPLRSPLLADEIDSLPPGLVITAGFDPLRDEGKAYADSLRAVGIAVEHLCYQDVIHAFISFAGGIEQGMDALHEAGRHLRTALAPV